MRRLGIIFWYDFSRRIFRWKFLFVTLGPFLIYGIILAMGLTITLFTENWKPFAYVDQADLLTESGNNVTLQSEIIPTVYILSFETENEARQALEREEIQAYFILPADFLQSHRVEMIYTRTPNSVVETYFRSYVRSKLIQSQPEEIAGRALAGTFYDIHTLGEENNPKNIRIQLLAPILSAGFFYLLIFSSSGYMLTAFIKEKENRVLETLLTSASPLQLLTGKTLAGLAAGQVSIFMWCTPLFLILLAFPNLLSFLGDDGTLLRTFVPMMLISVLASLMAGVIETSIGVTFSEPSENQMVTLLTMGLMGIPIAFLDPILQNPNNWLALALSAFPLTSPLTIILRATTGKLPEWQLWLSIVLQAGCTFGAFWIAAKVFRAGTLLQGKRFLRIQLWRRRQPTS